MHAFAERQPVAPVHTPLVEDEEGREGVPTAPIAGADTSSALQGAFGNLVVLDALRGAGSALHGAVREGLTAAIGNGGAPLWAGSNQEALVAMAGGLPTAAPAMGPAKQAAASSALDDIAAGLGADALLPQAIRREPDGFVDHYMQVNWDDRQFHALASQVGYPSEGPAGAWTELDRFLPAGIDPAARAGVQLACRIATGALDEVIVHRLAEEMGRPGEVLLMLRGIGTTIAPYVELEDPLGLALLGGCTVLDGVASAYHHVIGDLLTLLAQVELGIAILGQVPAAASAVLGPEGPALMETVVAAVVGPMEAIRVTLQATMAMCSMWRGTLDLAQLAYAQYRAGEAEIGDEMGRAAAYKELVRDHFLEMLADDLRMLVEVAGCIPLLGGAISFKNMRGLRGGSEGWSELGRVMSGPAPAGGPGLFDVASMAMDELVDTGPAQVALSTLGEAPMGGVDASDAMLRSFSYLPYEGRSGDRVEGARARLLADPPSWYQHLVNGIAGQNERTFAEWVSPTAWIGELVHAVPELAGVIANATPAGVALGCELLAGVAEAQLPRLVAVMDDAVGEWKPQLDEIVVALDGHVQQQALSLVHLQAMAGNLRGTIAAFRASDGPLEALLATSETAIGQLRACRVDPARLGLPPTIPPSMIAGMIEPVNAAVDQAVEALEVARDSALAEARATATGLLSALEARAEWLDGAIAEGGELALALRAQHAAAQDLVHRAAEAFVAWDATPDIDPAAVGGFLRDVAAACRAIPPVQQADPWPPLLATIAQPAVDRWRAAHTEDVDVLFGHESAA